MRWLYKLPLRLRSLFRRSRVEEDLSDELRFHLERLIVENIAKGMMPEEARYTALRELGGVEQIKEECRDMRRVNYIENLIQDVRYGLRMLAKNPGFTAVAIVTLALGIGATTAIFSVVDAVVLQSAPYAKPGELAEITERGPQTAPGEINEVSTGDFTDWQEQAPAFQGLAAYERWQFSALTGGGEPDEVWISPVTTSLFRVLGVNAVRGRTFAANESRAVVLSHSYWQSHFPPRRRSSGRRSRSTASLIP
jgi:MacB-like periplasmic core domain